MTMFIRFFCFRPLGLAIKLNFNISKVKQLYFQLTHCSENIITFISRVCRMLRILLDASTKDQQLYICTFSNPNSSQHYSNEHFQI